MQRLVLFLFITGMLSGCTVLEPAHEEATVVEVVDGDTVRTADGETVRLVGINAPEDGERYYEQATQRLEHYVLNKSVELEPGTDGQDQYGRLLRYVYVNETLVNAALVRDGLATAYYVSEPVKHWNTLDRAQRRAREQGNGLWQRSPDADCITVHTLHYDADGNDNQNLNDEYVTFHNRCNSVEMTGWTMKDAGTNTYTFPGTTVGANDTVTVYTGSGRDAAGERYWGRSRSAVWNNDGDELYLREENGLLAVYTSY